jgi:hypothetical protein
LSAANSIIAQAREHGLTWVRPAARLKLTRAFRVFQEKSQIVAIGMIGGMVRQLFTVFWRKWVFPRVQMYRRTGTSASKKAEG